MEPVVYEETPLADYLRGEPPSPLSISYPSVDFLPSQDGGDEPQSDWAPGATTPDPESSTDRSSPSPPSSPSPFAPTGRPLVKARFRKKAPNDLRVDVPKPVSLRSIRKNYSVRSPIILDSSYVSSDQPNVGRSSS
jgi:hypothetical protein